MERYRERQLEFLQIAQELEPAIRMQTAAVQGAVRLEQGTGGITCIADGDYHGRTLGAGDVLTLDLGDHYVGHVGLRLSSVGSHPDAPAWLRLRYAERPDELFEDVAAYHGWISKGWIQQEEIHLDVLPANWMSVRRYACRYVQIEVLDVSSKYRLVIENAYCVEQTSACDERLQPYANPTEDPLLQRMDVVACRTLRGCMQQVFEDGPKRDRRLWLGDLRLEALANYETYHQNALVRRCLYLFAGTADAEGRVPACLFLEPEVCADDTFMFDYSLLYVAAVRDYMKATGDMESVRDLWPTAYHQIELAGLELDGHGIVRDRETLGWCFVDWNLALNKQASAQGVYLYSLLAAQEIAQAIGDAAACEVLADAYESGRVAARQQLYDPAAQVFVSGADRQVSWASQIWMVLGGVTDPEEGRALLAGMADRADALPVVTPYAMHHLVEAWLSLGEREQALRVLTSYWGGMVQAGADTFWELYNPENPAESPYGGTVVNSYCHAWSCAPAYYLRRYYAEGDAKA